MIDNQTANLLNKAEQALDSILSPATNTMPHAVRTYELEEFQDRAAQNATVGDTPVDLQIKIGKTHIPLDESLRLQKGSVVPLDQQLNEPVDIYADGRLIARGKVLVLDGQFGVRIVELA